LLNLQTIGEVAGLLRTTAERMAWTLRRVNSLCHKLTITDLDCPRRKPREVYDPFGPLRSLQRALYKKVLLPGLDRCANSHGGVPDKNQLTCVEQHKRQKFVYCGDIQSFYPGIHFERVRLLFIGLGCSAEVARALTRLCTNHHRLEQGFITSPILADRIFRPADERIIRLCDKYGLVYTRYVDDITISSPFNLKRGGITKIIAGILRGSGFKLNARKNRFGSVPGGAVILGLRLDKGRPDVTTAYYNETVRRLTDMAALGNGMAFQGPFWTRNELFGRVRYVCWVNPHRQKTLVPLWRSLQWDQIEAEAMRRGITARHRRFIVRRGYE
jgi:RNA-directed DNA polymerase